MNRKILHGMLRAIHKSEATASSARQYAVKSAIQHQRVDRQRTTEGASRMDWLHRTFSCYLPTELVAGVNSARTALVAALQKNGISRVLLVADPGVVRAGLLEGVLDSLVQGGIDCPVFAEVEPNPSAETCLKAADAAGGARAQAFVCVGGGSAMDVGKAAGVLLANPGDPANLEGVEKFSNIPLPVYAVPTTAGTGSEVTPFTVVTLKERQYKMTIVSRRIIPVFAALDPLLLSTMPAPVAAACGIDAFIHAFEAFINRVASPFSDALGLEAMRLTGTHLRAFTANRADASAGMGMLIASTLAGMAFTQARLGAIHAMSHPLSAIYGIPHGVANGVLMPFVARFNQLADTGKYRRVAEALGKNTQGLDERAAGCLCVAALCELNEDIGIPRALGPLGVKADAIPAMAKDAMLSGNIAINPRTITVSDVEEIYRQAL